MKRFFLCVYLICFPVIGLASQEISEIIPVFYGQGVVTFGNPQAPEDKIRPLPSLGSAAWMRQITGFSLEILGEFWEVKAQAQVLWDGQAARLESGESWAQADWQKIFFLRMGYEKTTSGPGRVLDLWPQPVPKDSTQFLAWGGNEPQKTEPMVNLRGIWENFALETHILPFKPSLPLADVEGAWFFRAQIPSVFDVPSLGQYTLNNMDYDIAPAPHWVWSPSVLSQFRWSLDYLEILGAYYAGWDGFPPINAQVSLPGGNLFNLKLKPERKQVQQGVLGFQFSGNDWEIWVEGRGSMNKVLVLTKTSSNIPIPLDGPFMTVDRMVLEACGGVAWKFWTDWEFSLEALGWWTGEQENLDIPDYTRSWSGTLGWNPGLFPLSASLIILGSFQSSSGLGVINLTYPWADGIELWTQIPGFWGEKGSEWGQFSQRALGQIGWRWLL